MSKQREALNLALKALQRGRPQIVGVLVQQDQDNAIQAILEALTEPEKTNQCGETCERAKLCAICASGVSNNEPLTDEEMRDAFLADPDPILKLYKVSAGLSCAELDEILKRVARAIERAHGIGVRDEPERIDLGYCPRSRLSN